jgi:N6-L-threonylcarbamoyladenine synthase
MKILAVETSCDETAAAVLEIKNTSINTSIYTSIFKILSTIVSSQIKIHAKWGGVVPSLAKRAHQRNLIPVLKKSLKDASLVEKSNLKTRINEKKLKNFLKKEEYLSGQAIKFLKRCRPPRIDLIATTIGPGLEPALWVGVNFAKALAEAWKKPIVGINHMEGHFFSVFLEKKRRNFRIPKIKFPAVALLVSGGHTQLILAKDWLKYKILGETKDDAAGEAFDKVARMLSLGYPGGPILAATAAKFKKQVSKIKNRMKKESRLSLSQSISLPRPMLNSKDYNFSFSGLKTAVLYKWQEFGETKDQSQILKTAMAYEFQQAVTEVLTSKTIKAVKNHQAKTIILAGGVAANRELRKQLKKEVLRNDLNCQILLPSLRFCSDNAAMIALAAYFRFGKNKKTSPTRLKAQGNLRIT